MNRAATYSLRAAKDFYGISHKIATRHKVIEQPFDYIEQEASDLIKQKVSDDKPCMICRFGKVELNALVRYINISRASNFPCEKSVSYILGNAGAFWWSDGIKRTMQNNAGFFPITEPSLEAFGRRMTEDIKDIDILGFSLDQETEILEQLKNVSVIRLKDLDPYRHHHPWSEALENKIVLVVHPFSQSIQQQYEKRDLLFQDKRILPKFELKTLQSVQSICGNNAGFDSWFDALDWMCEKISSIEFDVAIIGAGAYGLPLASYVKNIGKKSIHIGGATQILFGIRGSRWDNKPFFRKLYNSHWTRPLPSEVPSKYKTIEGGAYW
ncbi:MAG: hypothetical protein WBA76_06240 [Phormidesmis sp.]